MISILTVYAGILGVSARGIPTSTLGLDEDLSLLQLSVKPQHRLQQPLDKTSQAERLSRAFPLAWLHIPKTGSSFNNFLVHLPGVCPGVPDDTVISVETFGPALNGAFKHKFHPITPDGACGDHLVSWGNHSGMWGDEWDKHYKGHGLIMLRQPEQRIMSGYMAGHHSWTKRTPPHSALEYAQVMQGCSVRMLTHGNSTNSDVTCGGEYVGPATPEDVSLAIRRLRTGFVFVGLTDQWALSMCLGHRIFGGPCRSSDFVDGRVTNRDRGPEEQIYRNTTMIRLKPKPYDTTPLGTFRDPYDGALYEVAEEIFKSELERYNVSMESCQQCFEEAELFIAA